MLNQIVEDPSLPDIDFSELLEDIENLENEDESKNKKNETIQSNVKSTTVLENHNEGSQTEEMMSKVRRSK